MSAVTGRPEFDSQPFTYWDSARDLLGLMDHLGIERAVVGGMSQGGFLSLRATLLAPERVRALILLDTSATTEEPEKLEQYQQMADTWINVGPVDELAHAVAEHHHRPPRREPAMDRQVAGPARRS